MTYAIIRGKNGRRHDFGDSPVRYTELSPNASGLLAQMTPSEHLNHAGSGRIGRAHSQALSSKAP
jgi:hypothetical protein